MTNYGKWDAFVATLSSSDEDEDEGADRGPAKEAETASKAADAGAKKGGYGWGKPLDERGQIDRSGELTVGNAKGNALSTNEAPQKVFQITEWAWTQSEDAVEVTLDVTRARNRCVSDVTRQRDFAQDMVRCTMRDAGVEVRVRDQAGAWELAFGLVDLPGIDPERCSFRLATSPAETASAGPLQRVVLTLAKRRGGERWAGCGRARSFLPAGAEAAAPPVTVTRYSWSDAEDHATVYVTIPGVHLARPEDVRVRFRELSFDATCVVGGRTHRFAVTELPMEIQVDKSSHRVKENELRIRLKKWARCTWFKLQVHR